MAEQSANEALFDALVRHQVYLLRFSGSLRNRIIELLNKVEADMAEKIRDRLRNSRGLETPAEVRRLDVLLGILRNLRLRSWAEVNATYVEELTRLVRQEPQTMRALIVTTSPVVVDIALPSAETLRAIVRSRPFEGKTMRQWAQTIQDEDIRRIENAVRVGMVQGETSDVIARRVVGSARLKGSDGVTEITRRQADALVRTATNFVANEARTEFLRSNSDLFQEERFVATLDSRTTAVCRANDGKRFPIGRGPRPPLHFRCRSLRVAVFDADSMVQRPAKPVTERQLVREFADQRGLKAPRDRAGLPRGTKGAYDQFARQRIRQLTGRVTGDMTYQEWMKRQPASFQDDVLGKTRGALFRRGGLQLDQFVNRAGDELPLRELARRHAQAFRAAGLNPADFLRR